MLAEKVPITVLVNQIRNRVISKDQILNDMRTKAQDNDFEVGPTSIGLKDSASQMRIEVPARGTSCTHHMCFDAATYLQMQEQAPLWQCPICDKPTSLANIAIDQ